MQVFKLLHFQRVHSEIRIGYQTRALKVALKITRDRRINGMRYESFGVIAASYGREVLYPAVFFIVQFPAARELCFFLQHCSFPLYLGVVVRI